MTLQLVLLQYCPSDREQAGGLKAPDGGSRPLTGSRPQGCTGFFGVEYRVDAVPKSWMKSSLLPYHGLVNLLL